MWNKDEVQGAVEQAKGKAKEKAGEFLKDIDLEEEGVDQQAAGSAQQTVGKARRKVGEVVEDVGKAIKK